MQIGLVHYHLLQGGVTTVLLQQARMLQRAGHRVVIFTGQKGKALSDIPIVEIPGLGYEGKLYETGVPPIAGREKEGPHQEEVSAEDLARHLEKAIAKSFSSIDVLHVHNPLLRKNRQLLPALALLKERGIPLFLQVHDFAEDFRPDVYAFSVAYPDDCHYGVINSRDYSFMIRAGALREGVHIIPNVVVPIQSSPSGVEQHERDLFLYPVRGIRRKNLGEALLLSLFLPRGTRLAITLPPTSSRDEPIYQSWKQLAQDLRLPVEFEVGLHHPLPELYGRARAIITTSVKEGFGFCFLEPWTAGRAVIGRRIESVCSDFEKEGLQFPDLYESIDIPFAYIPPVILRKKIEGALRQVYGAFNLELDPHVLKLITDDLFSREVFDFGRMDEELQRDVITMAASNEAVQEDLRELNPFLQNLQNWNEDPALIEANKTRVFQHYREQVILDRLLAAYRGVQEHPVRMHISRSILLDLFLDPLKVSLVGIGLL